jgi:hypothetical protein
MTQAAFPADTTLQPAAAWGAVLSMALCVAMLIASEFMPVSLLTPMAEGLGATQGMRQATSCQTSPARPHNTDTATPDRYHTAPV